MFNHPCSFRVYYHLFSVYLSLKSIIFRFLSIYRVIKILYEANNSKYREKALKQLHDSFIMSDHNTRAEICFTIRKIMYQMLCLHLSFYQSKKLLRSSYLTLVHRYIVDTGSNNSSQPSRPSWNRTGGNLKTMPRFKKQSGSFRGDCFLFLNCANSNVKIS